MTSSKSKRALLLVSPVDEPDVLGEGFDTRVSLVIGFLLLLFFLFTFLPSSSRTYVASLSLKNLVKIKASSGVKFNIISIKIKK